MFRVAILIDGGFYRKRARCLFDEKHGKEAALQMIEYVRRHVKGQHDHPDSEVYRIFYYDCPPISKQIYHPLLKRAVDFSKTEQYRQMNDFLDALRSQRKVALRLGTLSNFQSYTLKGDAVKQLCNGKLTVDDLNESHFMIEARQKGVDMKIAVDITSMALKKQVDRIVLISGDSDFVPAAKLARREGIDFVLDPMWAHIEPSLNEHIDGLHSCCPRPKTDSSEK